MSGEKLVARERLWTESTAEERLDALRNEVVYQKRVIQNLLGDVEMLLAHRHGEDNTILAPLKSSCALGGPRNDTHIPIGLRLRE